MDFSLSRRVNSHLRINKVYVLIKLPGWANNVGFIFGKPVQPGFDPIIGANVGGSGPRSMVGVVPDQEASTLELTSDVLVVPRGGEYFFSPSISAIQDVLAQSA